MTGTLKFKQSRNWWQDKDLKWFIDNAEFAFIKSSYKGNRFMLVLKEKLNGRNCFQFNNDRYGILISSEMDLKDTIDENHVYRGNDVIKLFVKFLNDWGAGEFVNPKFSLLNIFNTKDKMVTIK